MSIEAAVVVDVHGNALHWHQPTDCTTVAIPDSRTLWDVIWKNRDELYGIAHSHPGIGLPGPSLTDVTTFDAVERALGRNLTWWITSETDLALILRAGRYGPYEIARDYISRPWLKRLRQISYERSR